MLACDGTAQQAPERFSGSSPDKVDTSTRGKSPRRSWSRWQFRGSRRSACGKVGISPSRHRDSQGAEGGRSTVWPSTAPALPQPRLESGVVRRARPRARLPQLSVVGSAHSRPRERPDPILQDTAKNFWTRAQTRVFKATVDHSRPRSSGVCCDRLPSSAAYEPGDFRFESCRARQSSQPPTAEASNPLQPPCSWPCSSRFPPGLFSRPPRDQEGARRGRVSTRSCPSQYQGR
jgi:hypothetical protein